MTEPFFSARQGALYGGLGLPLAFLALPLYVILPNHYAREFGVPLALLGALLLSARLLDAFIDPLLDAWAIAFLRDRWAACWAPAPLPRSRWPPDLPPCSYLRCAEPRPCCSGQRARWS
jgi:hypothetical protein